MSNKLKDAVKYLKEYNCAVIEREHLKTLRNLAEKYLEASEELPEKYKYPHENCNCSACEYLNERNDAIEESRIPYMKLKEENEKYKRLFKTMPPSMQGQARMFTELSEQNAKLKELYHKKCNEVRELKEQLARLKGE